jgi:hypothetical protein
MRTGRISCRITGTPARAICHAASLPASPPPITWMGFVMGVGLDYRLCIVIRPNRSICHIEFK